MSSGDRVYIKPSWDVCSDCTLKIFANTGEMFSMEFTPDQAIKLGAELIIAAQKAKKKPA